MEDLSYSSVSIFELDELQRRSIALVIHEAGISLPLSEDIGLINTLYGVHDRMWASQASEVEDISFDDKELDALNQVFDWFVNNQPADWPHRGLYEGTLSSARRLAGVFSLRAAIELVDIDS